jgi:hypothetical protein
VSPPLFKQRHSQQQIKVPHVSICCLSCICSCTRLDKYLAGLGGYNSGPLPVVLAWFPAAFQLPYALASMKLDLQFWRTITLGLSLHSLVPSSQR